MKLAAYLSENDLTHNAFARLIGVRQSTVSRYVNDRRMPRRVPMRKIVEVTKGAVTRNDFDEAAA